MVPCPIFAPFSSSASSLLCYSGLRNSSAATSAAAPELTHCSIATRDVKVLCAVSSVESEWTRWSSEFGYSFTHECSLKSSHESLHRKSLHKLNFGQAFAKVLSSQTSPRKTHQRCEDLIIPQTTNFESEKPDSGTSLYIHLRICAKEVSGVTQTGSESSQETAEEPMQLFLSRAGRLAITHDKFGNL